MATLTRTDSSNSDFVGLIRLLDTYLAEMDGADHSYYAQFNTVAMIKHVVVAYDGDRAVGCGAIKEYRPDTMEVKRMYVVPECRGRGIAKEVLSELERWTSELGYAACILETGKRQKEAVGLYRGCGYSVIPNYGQYEHVENSICFEKRLTPDRGR